MKILALSYLFPNPASPEYGIFVYHRLKAVQEFCAVRVIAPVQCYPLCALLRPSLSAASPGDATDMGGVATWYPRLTVIPRYFKFLDALSYYLAVKPLVERMGNDGYAFDLIDAHWTYPDILAAFLIARRYRKPFIVTVRGKEALYPGEAGGRKLILDYCLRQADAVVALSRELAELVAAVGVDRSRVKVILNGVDTTTFRPLDRSLARRQLNLPRERKILLSVGRLTEAKGHQHVIEALAQARERNLELHVIGGVNPETDYSGALRRQVAALGLKNVVFHGGKSQEELALWYNAADLFCLASHGEGCPNVVLEALACGTPVVVTNVGSVKLMVGDESNGVVAGEASGFAAALAWALVAPWDRSRIAERMKEKSWRGCAREVVGLYREVLAGSGVAAGAGEGG